MPTREEIMKILEYGARAPSGDNTQPWKFRLRGNTLDIYNVPEKDASLYNFEQKASMTAHGALLENIIIASGAFGYSANFKLFPDPKNEEHIASVFWEKSEVFKDPLFDFIEKRATNRKPYDGKPIGVESKKRLFEEAGKIAGAELRLVEDEEKRKVLAGAFSRNERLVFENEFLHRFLFGHIRWTEKEAKEQKDGFSIETFELNPVAKIAFRILKHWRIASVLKSVFPKIAGEENRKTYLSAPVMGAVITAGNSRKDFFDAGRVVQRVWLTAAAFGLSMQPITGIIFLKQRIYGNGAGLSKKEKETVLDAYRRISEVFGAEGKTIAFPFRIGFDGEPSARTYRLDAKDVLI